MNGGVGARQQPAVFVHERGEHDDIGRGTRLREHHTKEPCHVRREEVALAGRLLANVNWFALLLTNHDLKGLREFQLYYLRWRTRTVAYMALFTDAYPPFGDAPYPVSIEVGDPQAPRDRASIAVRVILVVPHLVVLCFVLLGWFVTTIIAWFAILFTGAYPKGLSPFGVGAMRWLLRVEAYALLLVDEYPPFSLD